MIVKHITFCGQPAVHACDAVCSKAWGINNRPRIEYDANDPDDYAYRSDDELVSAPADPGTYEGGHAKPRSVSGPDDINKWCVRECERSQLLRPGEPIVLRDFSRRRYNQPWKHEGAK